MTTPIENKKNLIVDTATQCNLLCKIIIDYMSNKKCHIVEDITDPNNIKKYIQYEEGSFINYRDTNYEVDKIYFFSPSRHSIDGEKFDLEVNIHHGGERIIAHNHYHNDVEDTTPLRKHFHYHSKKGGDNNHHEAKQAGIKSEIVSCILFNIGEHKGSEVNVFFNQFVHKLDSKEPINVHSNWNIEQLLPKKKSYFMYEYKKEENDYNVIVFDNIQSIESGIFEIIKDKCFAPEDILRTDTALTNTVTEKDTLKNASLFYRTNVEMITDEQYKKSKRDQIKDLLSIVRLNYMKDEVVSANEYIDGADKILAAATGTCSLSSFQDKQSTAIEVANLWNNWGQGVFSEITSSKIYKDVEQKDSDKKREYYKNMKFDDNIDYLSLFENKFKEQINNALNDFYKVDIDFFNPIEIEEKIKETNFKYNIDLYSLDTIRENLLKYNKLIKYSGWEEINVEPIVSSEVKSFTGSIEDYLSDFNIFNPEQMDYDIEINYNKVTTELIGIGSSYVYEPKVLNSNTNIIYEPDNEELIVKDKYILPKPDTYHKVYYTVKDLGNKLITKYFEDDDIKMSTDNILRIWRFFINLNPDYQSKNLINLFGIQEFIFPLTIFYNDFKDPLSLQTFQIYHTPESIIAFLNNGETVVYPDIKMTFYGTNEDFIDENGENLLANDILNKTLGNHNFKITLDPTTDSIDYESLSIKKYFGYYYMGETFFEELNFDDLSDRIPSFIFTFTPKFEIIIDNVFKFCDKNDFSFRVLVSAPEMDHTIDNEECQDWLSNEAHYEGSLWKFWEKPEIFQKDGKTWDNLSYKEKNHIRNGLLKSHSGNNKDTNLTDQEAFDLDNDTGEKTLKWFRHNKCRNPGNVKAAPWCYTKNPKRRWNYCVQPDYTKYIARIVLVCVFIMVGIVAIVFVKYLFRFEIISKIVAALTGANFASEAIFKANQTVNNIKTNVKSITG